MPRTTHPGLHGYRALYALVAAAPAHLDHPCTPAEEAAWLRRLAGQCAYAARDKVCLAYAITRRYAGDPRWGRLGTNPEAQPALIAARSWLRQARICLRDAERAELAALTERRAA